MSNANISFRDLRKSLNDLHALSNTTTNRLDNTYYSVLEKLSILQASIASLKELSLMARQLNEDFDNDSQTITREFQEQLKGFEGFQAQHNTIEDLQSRIQAGRDKVNRLRGRVEVVRKRAERWSKVEEQWQEKTRKRIRLLWSLSVMALVVLVSFLIFQYTPARNQGPGVMKGLDVPSIAARLSDFEQNLLDESLAISRQASEVLEELRKAPDAPSEEDSQLKAFDEL